jgi:hypothetical protein
MKKTKNEHFHENGKVGRSDATPIKLLSVDNYDLNLVMIYSLALKYQGNDYQRPIHPFASEVLGLKYLICILNIVRWVLEFFEDRKLACIFNAMIVPQGNCPRYVNLKNFIFDKIKLVLYSRVKKSSNHLTLMHTVL